MYDERHIEILTRWLDGEPLAEQEQGIVDKYLKTDPDLQPLAHQQSGISQALQHAFQPEMEPPHADFFNTHLQRLITRESEIPSDHTPAQPENWKLSDILTKWRLWAMPAAALGLVLAFLAGMQVNQPAAPPARSGLVETPVVYTPTEGVTAQVWESLDSATVVVELNGLPAISDSLGLQNALDARSDTNNQQTPHPIITKTLSDSHTL